MHIDTDSFSASLLFSVYKVFENVAQKYDVMNDAMSLGVHRLWKDNLLHYMHPQPGARLLDVAGGTGMEQIAWTCVKRQTEPLPPHSFTFLFCLWWSTPAGDISFRFLDYVRFQQERQKRRATRSMQTPSWQDISINYSTEDEDGSCESRAVVCDINKEMLKVGKQKADSMGIRAGRFFNVKLSQLSSSKLNVCHSFEKARYFNRVVPAQQKLGNCVIFVILLFRFLITGWSLVENWEMFLQQRIKNCPLMKAGFTSVIRLFFIYCLIKFRS